MAAITVRMSELNRELVKELACRERKSVNELILSRLGIAGKGYEPERDNPLFAELYPNGDQGGVERIVRRGDPVDAELLEAARG